MGLIPELVQKFKADKCAEDGELSIEFVLKSSVAGDNTQSFSMKIAQDPNNQTSTTGPVVNTPTGSTENGSSASEPIDSIGGGNQQVIENKVEPIKLEKLRISPTGKLTLRFSKPVMILVLQSRGRQLEDISLGDSVNVYV